MAPPSGPQWSDEEHGGCGCMTRSIGDTNMGNIGIRLYLVLSHRCCNYGCQTYHTALRRLKPASPLSFGCQGDESQPIYYMNGCLKRTPVTLIASFWKLEGFSTGTNRRATQKRQGIQKKKKKEVLYFFSGWPSATADTLLGTIEKRKKMPGGHQHKLGVCRYINS